MLFRAIAAAALAVALPLATSMSGAFAQSAVPASTATAPAVDVRAACKADMDKLCPNIERGDARRTCIETNRDKFSDGCQAARNAARDGSQDRRQAFRAACAGDIAKLCANIEKGNGRVVDCMRTNADKLTPACKTELTSLSANVQAAGPDAAKKP